MIRPLAQNRCNIVLKNIPKDDLNIHTCNNTLKNPVFKDILIIHASSDTRGLEEGYVVSGTEIKLAVTQSIANPLLYMRISTLRATCCSFPSLPHFTTWLSRTETFSFTSLPSKSSAMSSEGAGLSVGMFWEHWHNYGTHFVAFGQVGRREHFRWIKSSTFRGLLVLVA